MYCLRMLLRKPVLIVLFAIFLALSSLLVWFSLEVSSVLYSSTEELSYEFSTIVLPRSRYDVFPLEDISRDGSWSGFPGHVSQNYGMLAYNPSIHPVISITSDPISPSNTLDNPYNCIVFVGICVEETVEDNGVDRVQHALLSVLKTYALHEDYPTPRQIQTSVNLVLYNDAIPFEVGKQYILYLEQYQGNMLKNLKPLAENPYVSAGEYDEGAICSGVFPQHSKWVRNSEGEEFEALDDDILTFTQFSGEADDFLKSSAGARWAEKIAYIQKAVQSAELVAIEDPAYIVAFKDGRATIIEGRNFTQKELEDGAKVCIVSAALARASNFKLGDRISIELFDSDYEYYRSMSRQWISPAFPKAHTSLGSEAFTVIGLYTLPETQDDLYSFTANSMFIPVMALSAETRKQAKELCQATTNMTSLVLNGREWEAFENFTTSLDNNFSYLVIGGNYEQFKSLFNDLQDSVKLFRYIALPLWGVLLLVYLVLFWFRTLRTTALMRSQGMTTFATTWHCFLIGFVPALPAAVIMLLFSQFFMSQTVALLLQRGMGGLINAEQLAQTAITINGEGFHSVIGCMLILFGTLALGLFALSLVMACQNVMKLLRYRE